MSESVQHLGSLTHTVQAKTLVLVLGERSWSNIPSDVSVDALLFDDSWRHKSKMRLHAAKRIFDDASGSQQNKSLKKILGLSCIAIAIAIGIQVYSNDLDKIREKKSATLVYDIKPIKPAAEPPLHRTIEAASSGKSKESFPQIGDSELVLSEKVTDSDATIVDYQTIRNSGENSKIASESEPQAKAVAAATDKHIVKTKSISRPVVSSRVATILPSIPMPIPTQKNAKSTVLLPPFPQTPIAQQSVKTIAEPEKSLLAVDETKHVDMPAAKSTDIADSRNQNIDKEAVKVAVGTETAKPVVIVKADLPIYNIITLTKKSIVIRDKKTKAPRQFFVGDSLPSGEVIKSVNENAGLVVTDSRTLRMQ